jgi:type IV pilus assembly protein PilX
MRQPQQTRRSFQHGIVLVSSLLLLLVVTIMALSMFRSFGIQEKIAGNVREKQRAIQAAVSTEQFAEWWLSNKSNAPVAVSAYSAASADVACVAVVDANTGAGQICNNTMAANGIIPATVPWALGVYYTPSGMGTLAAPCAGPLCLSTDQYFNRPQFYIADMGSYGRSGELYQVDAYSYGLSANTISVVESTVAVSCLVCNPGAL